MEVFDYQVLKLTTKFYTDHPRTEYPEILSKDTRPYNCLLLQSKYGYYICIPLRSHIKHQYGFWLHKDGKGTYAGLDYTKIIIIEGHDLNDYLEPKTALINQKQFITMRNRMPKIVEESQDFIDDYISYLRKDDGCIDEREFIRRYSCSTLQYFHKELKIILTKGADPQ